MNCCGNKRQSLNFFSDNNQTALKQQAAVEMNLNAGNKNGEILYRFIGKTSLEVNSLYGTQRYIFTNTHPLVSVLPEDVFLMRAYAELIEMKA